MDDAGLRSGGFYSGSGKARAWDQQGKEYIDLRAGLRLTRWAMHPRRCARCVKRPVAKFFWHTGNGYTSEPALRLAKN